MPILGFDYGNKRIGVAIVPDDTNFALPLTTISGTPDEHWRQLDILVKKQIPTTFVVGMPYNMSGGEGEQAEIVREFAAKLFERYNVPVELIDERMSSMEAQSSGATDIDASSAAIILDSYLTKHSKGDILDL